MVLMGTVSNSDYQIHTKQIADTVLCRLHGSYEAIEGGITMDAMVDLTGGLAERYDVNEYDPSIYQLISRAHKAGAFVTSAKKV